MFFLQNVRFDRPPPPPPPTTTERHCQLQRIRHRRSSSSSSGEEEVPGSALRMTTTSSRLPTPPNVKSASSASVRPVSIAEQQQHVDKQSLFNSDESDAVRLARGVVVRRRERSVVPPRRRSSADETLFVGVGLASLERRPPLRSPTTRRNHMQPPASQSASTWPLADPTPWNSAPLEAGAPRRRPYRALVNAAAIDKDVNRSTSAKSPISSPVRDNFARKI